jgi:ATP-dependent Clp protease ATP-binding subunit ClpC
MYEDEHLLSANKNKKIKMKKPLFVSWYYNQGMHELLEIWENFLVFFWNFFSIRELLVTLFYPWHRDVQMKGWRGLHPLKSLNVLFLNIVSRLIGAIVRSGVIFFGALLLALVAVVGILVIVFWIATPLFLIAFLIFSSYFNVPILAVGIFFALWALAIFKFYSLDNRELAIAMEFEDFFLHPAFTRVCSRLGVTRKKFPHKLLENTEEFAEFLKVRGLSQDDYKNIIKIELTRAMKLDLKHKFWRKENLVKIKPIGLHWRFGYTVHLDRYASDLTEYDNTEYAEVEMIGRKEESDLMTLILERPDQNCVVLVGNEGIGKKSLVHSFARKIRHSKINGWLKTERVLLLDLGRAISDAISHGEDVERFLRTLLHEATFAGNVILVIEHLDHYLGKEANTYHPDISAVLGEYIHLPSLQIIATSTQKEYHRLIEKEEQIIKYFEVVEVREPNDEETIEIVIDRLEKYESAQVLFTYQAIKKAIVASGRHSWETPLPERAIDLAMNVLMFWEKNGGESLISEESVDDYLSLKTGVAHGEIREEERKKLLNLEEILHRQVIGQEEAVKQVAESLRRARSGIGNSKKPIGSFLFLGPTGVGKTETAKALAKAYFGDEKHMVRLDMSEFQTAGSIDRLLGSSQLNQQGRLVTKIKDNPYSLLLLDEIEKAYPEILDIFLQILDEGFVTDAFGEKVNFRNCIIIATSNVGAALIKKKVEAGDLPEEIQKEVVDYAIDKGIFRVEFLNRFEGVVFFRPLRGKELNSVVWLQLQKLARRLRKEKNIEIDFDENMVEKIIEKGYNPVFGARSLNRYIEDSVEDLIAKKIIAGEIVKGEKIKLRL